MISFFLYFMFFGCMPKTSFKLGTVDSKEDDVCVVQLVDESFIVIKAPLCTNLVEGDLIRVVR